MKKKKQRFDKFLVSCLGLFIATVLLLMDTETTSAALLSWSALPTVSLSGGNGYYKLSDLATATGNHSLGTASNQSYDQLKHDMSTRVLYQKKFSVSYGTTLKLAGATSDTGSGGSNTTNSASIYWNIVEFSSSGMAIADSGWLPTATAYQVGVSSATSMSTTLSRRNVAYIILIFRSSSGDMSIGGSGVNITPAQVVNAFSNLYICYQPFTYTTNCGVLGTNSSTTRLGLSSTSFRVPDLSGKTGYNFYGWKVSSSSALTPNWMNGNQYTTSQINTWLASANLYNSLFGNVTFTANYEPWKHTVSYNANGGSGAPSSQTKTYGSNLTLQSTKPTRKGYTFSGWNTKADGSGTSYAAGAAYKVDQNSGTVTLYAQWTQNKYSVTYNANGGFTSQGMKVFHYNDAIDLSPMAQKAGKIFVGWNTDPNATKAISSLKMPDLATSTNADYSKDWELTLYAIYSIPVSDVSNHNYPEYEQINEEEVFFRVWEIDNEDNCRIYPLTYTKDVTTMEYQYILPSTDISSFVSGMQAYGYQILAYDNAGNYKSLYVGGSSGIPVPPPMPKKYLQTVNHYRYDAIIEDWVKFDTTTELILEGITYVPEYITPPVGYKNHHIDASYVVSKVQSSKAYYMPVDYILTFDAMGGSCSIKDKMVTYGDYYGNMPTPTKTGHTFKGWYTEKENGEVVIASKKYLVAGDTTVYARWEANDYQVSYDYWTNGGSDVTVKKATLPYGSQVDLSVVAEKQTENLKDWQFVGWNTEPDAIVGLDSFTLPDHDVTLYAIFKKDITVTIHEKTDLGVVIRSLNKTIYNKEKEATFIMEQVNEWSDWIFLGWTTESGAKEEPFVGISGQYATSDSITLYGLYTSTVTLGYDTNGSTMVISDQTKDSYYNASGNSAFPEFIIADEPILSQHSFVSWEDSVGNVYMSGESIIFDQDTRLIANWDKHPELEAYDRYFTLEQATNAEITEETLLEKVKGTDLEDGTLVNGVDVIVKDYDASTFTSISTDTEVETTYQATDSFGNVVTKTITVKVIDTSMKKSTKKSYVRFISDKFFTDVNGNLVSSSEGGLEETSVWRTDPNYFDLLQRTLSNSKANVETWYFTQEELKEMKKDL